MSSGCKVSNLPTAFEDVEVGVKRVKMLVPCTNSLASLRAKLRHSRHGGGYCKGKIKIKQSCGRAHK